MTEISDLEKKIVELWNEPHMLSANNIGIQLGMTKNAVVGKVHRLRLKGIPMRISTKFARVQGKRRAKEAESKRVLPGSPKPKSDMDLPTAVPSVKLGHRISTSGPFGMATPPPKPAKELSDSAKRKAYDALRPSQCKYLYGDYPPFTPCTNHVKGNSSWCEQHYDKVFLRRD